ncbi:hypothetical protein ACNTMW_31990 [Planosporangium sp. 12N6]|uniref:hypothetical protein n=1 Tax=Planosporangium spinosum TaxID=3402278 RepID=UPI003CE6BB6A
MLSSPVWRGTPVVAFCVGLMAGGALTAGGLMVLGSLVRPVLPVAARWAVVGVALGAVLLRQAGIVSFPLPENRRLVPESVLRFGRHLGPLQFGLEMGTGVRTYLPSSLPYLAAVLVFVLASVPAALCAGVGFGVGRALMVTSNLRYRSDNGWDAEWLRHRRTLAPVTGGAFVVSLLGLLAATWR